MAQQQQFNALGDRFKAAATRAGATVHKATALGAFLHIDTNKADEPKIRELLGHMKPKRIDTLEPGADGKHLCGSRHHRIVATF